MGLLDRIKTMADLPPGPITAQGLMSDDKQPSLMRPQSFNFPEPKAISTKAVDSFADWYKKGNRGYKTMQSLNPEFREPLQGLIDDVYRTTGMMMKVNTLGKGGGFRTPQQQQKMFESGSSEARPFQSAHSFGIGVDFSIFDPNSKKGEVLYDKNLYREIGNIALRHGLQNDATIGDYNHLMPLGWKTPEKQVNEQGERYKVIPNYEAITQERREPSKKKTAYPEPKSARLLEYQRLLKEDVTK